MGDGTGTMGDGTGALGPGTGTMGAGGGIGAGTAGGVAGGGALGGVLGGITGGMPATITWFLRKDGCNCLVESSHGVHTVDRATFSSGHLKGKGRLTWRTSWRR